jgi:hypothetical protein
MITFREATVSDREFVCDGWVSSYRTAHAAGFVLMSCWRDVMWPMVEAVLRRPYVHTLVADDDGVLCGFLTFEGPGPLSAWRPDSRSAALDALPYVYYAYTKAPRRRGRRDLGTGIMSGLLRAANIDPTQQFGFACKTPSVVQLIDAGKIPGARWDPLRARYERDFHAGAERQTTRMAT